MKKDSYAVKRRRGGGISQGYVSKSRIKSIILKKLDIQSSDISDYSITFHNEGSGYYEAYYAVTFIYDNEEISLTDMEYVHDKASLNFVKDVISRTPHHHPYLPGSLFNGFSLVNSEGEAEYKIVGYSYNGQQIIWS